MAGDEAALLLCGGSLQDRAQIAHHVVKAVMEVSTRDAQEIKRAR